jgi:hypothetical protein
MRRLPASRSSGRCGRPFEYGRARTPCRRHPGPPGSTRRWGRRMFASNRCGSPISDQVVVALARARTPAPSQSQPRKCWPRASRSRSRPSNALPDPRTCGDAPLIRPKDDECAVRAPRNESASSVSPRCRDDSRQLLGHPDRMSTGPPSRASRSVSTWGVASAAPERQKHPPGSGQGDAVDSGGRTRTRQQQR